MYDWPEPRKLTEAELQAKVDALNRRFNVVLPAVANPVVAAPSVKVEGNTAPTAGGDVKKEGEIGQPTEKEVTSGVAVPSSSRPGSGVVSPTPPQSGPLLANRNISAQHRLEKRKRMVEQAMGEKQKFETGVADKQAKDTATLEAFKQLVQKSKGAGGS